MFDSLDDQIKADEKKSVSSKEKAMVWTIALLVTFALIGGIYVGVQFFHG